MKNNGRRERFKRVATKRTQKVLDSISALSKCSSSNYEYSENELSRIWRAVDEELRICKALFKKNVKKGEFTL